MLDVLVVEDTVQYVRRLRRLLCDTLSGYDVEFVRTRDEALARIAADPPDLLILDLIIPTAPGKRDAHASHGEAVLAAVRERRVPTHVIVLSGRDDVVRDFLIEKGADDFFVKGQAAAWEEEKLPARIEELIGHLACRSEAMQALREQLDTLSAGERVVTLQGPPGSGKEHVAEVIRKCSDARSRPLRGVGVRTLLPENNLAELTGRAGPTAQAGLLAVAGAVLVRDLADGLEENLQRQLARLIDSAEEGRIVFRPVGAIEPVASNCWLMLASTRPIDELAREGLVCEELYAAMRRHCVLRLPAPEERLEDVPELLEVFRRRARHEHKKRVRRVGQDVVAVVRRWLTTSPPAGGWDTIETMIQEAVARCDERELSVQHITIPPMPPAYEVLAVRDGQLETKQVSEVELAALEAQDWPLIMYAQEANGAVVVRRVRVDGEERRVDRHRIGRLLYVLARQAGQPVDVTSLWRELGLTSKGQTKRLIFELRRAIGDEMVSGRRSRFVASHYYQTYEFVTTTDFLLVRRLAHQPQQRAAGP